MTDVLVSYGPVFGVVALALLVAGLGLYLAILLVKKRVNGRDWHGDERRRTTAVTLDFSGLGAHLAPLLDLRADVRDLKTEVVERSHELRNKMEPLVTRLAVLEHDVQHLQRHCPLLDGREPR